MGNEGIEKRFNRVLPIIAALVYTLLALATTHPLWLHLAEALPSDIGDPLLNTWIQAWDAHAFLTDPLHLFEANIYYPLRNTLAYSEHLASTAILALPLQAISGEPLVAYNLSLLLSFPLAGLGMYLLVSRWTRRPGAAFLAGLAFAFAPYRLAAISHLQLLTIQWLPFSLLSLDRLLRLAQRPGRPAEGAPARRRWFEGVPQFVIFTTLQILASWYLAVFGLLVLGIYALGWLLAHARRGRPWPEALARLTLAGLLVSALTLPFALPYLDVLPQLRASRPLTWAVSFAAHPTDLLAAAPFLRFSGPLSSRWSGRSGFTAENTLFLGTATLLLALVGLVLGRPRWRPAALGTIFAASLIMTFAGPYRALIQIVPLLAVVRVPPRWIIPATFALAALVGYGLAAIRPALWSRIAVVIVSLVVVTESFAALLPLAFVGSVAHLPQVYHDLALAPESPPWAVVELPLHVAPAAEYPEAKRMYASSLGWWRLVNGYSGFTPERQVHLGQELSGFPDERALAALRAWGREGVRYLVVHPDEAPLDRGRWEAADRWQAERQTTLIPAGQPGPDDLYLINPYGDDLLLDPSGASDDFWARHCPTSVGATFRPPDGEGEIRLLAFLYQSGAAQPQAKARLTFYWQTSAALTTDYTVFVHSLAAGDQMLGQADGPPVANHYPTTAWQPGEIVQDSRLVPTGERYRIGLYNRASGERLPAFSAGGAELSDDAVVLSPAQP